MNVACPQCGNPNLDVDPQTNTVYCRQCGFAVAVDPQTGNVTPISGGPAPAAAGGGFGGAPAPAMGGYGGGGYGPAPAGYGGGDYGQKTLLGMDPLTFFLAFSVVGGIAFTAGFLGIEYLFLLEIILFLVYWYNH